MRGAAESVDVAGFVAAVKAKVDARLEALLAEEVELARGYGRVPGIVAEAFAELCLRGGKRLRPALMAGVYRALSGAGGEGELPAPLVEVACAWELLQGYFLVHDDWMDGDDTRRGKPAVHKRLVDSLGSEAYGILAGDYGAALAHRAVATCGCPVDRLEPLLRIFGDANRDVVLGQALDLSGADELTSIERMYSLKTARYTTRGPAMCGAILAGASANVQRQIASWSEPLGVAFQHVDDLLGAFGDPNSTGKPVGSDLLAGKKTYLLTLARGRTKVEGTVADMRAAIESAGARRDVEARIAALRAEGRAALGAPAFDADPALLLAFESLFLDRSA